MSEIGGWQPIETAPKDGTEFLGYDSLTRKMDVCVWQDWYFYQVQCDGEMGPSDDEFGYDWKTITHWRPLPAPPTQEDQA
jgi:hypothetical protein